MDRMARTSILTGVGNTRHDLASRIINERRGAHLVALRVAFKLLGHDHVARRRWCRLREVLKLHLVIQMHCIPLLGCGPSLQKSVCSSCAPAGSTGCGGGGDARKARTRFQRLARCSASRAFALPVPVAHSFVGLSACRSPAAASATRHRLRTPGASAWRQVLYRKRQYLGLRQSSTQAKTTSCCHGLSDVPSWWHCVGITAAARAWRWQFGWRRHHPALPVGCVAHPAHPVGDGGGCEPMPWPWIQVAQRMTSWGASTPKHR